MADSFASLKRSRETSLDRLTKEVQKITTNKTSKAEDDRFWQPEVDKSGNGYAVIRFLPAPSGEDVPWVRIWNHGFQGPGGWYIENSLTTLGTGTKDPVSEYNSTLWNSGNDKDKEIARKQKRRLTYISNIIVIKDASHPENEGKVFLYKFGKKIFDKINALMNPEFEDEKPTNPFDLWNGCNFKLKIRMVEGYRNYDKSEFDSVEPIADNDDDIERIWKSEHALLPFIAADQFKSYDDLKRRLDKVLGLSGDERPMPKQSNEDSDPWQVTPSRPSAAPSVGKTIDEDDGLDFFKKLAEDDEN